MGDNYFTISLNSGEILVVDIEATPMNYTEIIEAGIDLSDPQNYDFYNFSIKLFVELHNLTEYHVWFNPTNGGSSSYWFEFGTDFFNFFSGSSGGSGGGSSGYGGGGSGGSTNTPNNGNLHSWVPKGANPYNGTI